jgi:hypothetical protein
MAAIFCTAQCTEEALAAATAETIIQLVAASNHRIRVLGWGVFFDGTSATGEPVQVRLLRQTSAGTSSALTPVANIPITETIQTTALQDFSAEPSASDVLDVIECHPQGGYEKWFPPGYEILVAGGARIGIECTAPAIVNVRAKFFFEE